MQDTAELLTDEVKEREDKLVVPAVIAQEMVQSYGEYKALKPATALEEAAFTADGAYVTDGHPSQTGVVTEQDQILGFTRNAVFDSDKNRIVADLHILKDRTKPKVVTEIKGGRRTDVSIGFYLDELADEGSFDGEEYDVVQSNIVIDHVASLSPDSKGRCSSEEGCGLLPNMDSNGGVVDVAVNSTDGELEVKNALVAAGLEPGVRDCGCGRHHSHIVVGNNSGNGEVVNEENLLSGDSPDLDKDDTMSDEKDQKIDDLENQVENLEDEVQSQEDTIADLNQEIDSLEEELNGYKESERQDLVQELVDSHGLDKEKMEDKTIDELKDVKEMLPDQDKDGEGGGDGEGDGHVNRTPRGVHTSQDRDDNPLQPDKINGQTKVSS